MLNVHVVTSPDIKVQGVANEQALRALLETKTWEIGLITAAARQPEEAEMYRRWVKNLAQNLRESGVRVNVCGASPALCPRTAFVREQLEKIEAARLARAKRGIVDPPQKPVECADHILDVVRRASGGCDAVVAIYDRDQILVGLTHRGIRISPQILLPGTIVVERDHAEFRIY